VKPHTLVPPQNVKADTPLRLHIAAAIAFPDGSMSASGLRREGARGRLTIERIAGKDYTTLASIERMRELCRVEGKVPVCGSGLPGETKREKLPAMRHGLSSTQANISPQAALKAKLNAQSKS
jgi:hypothetical protein